MKKSKTEVSVLNIVNSPINVDGEKITPAVSTIIYNPIFGINYEEFSDANEEEKAIFLRSKCREAEIVIATLSQMFEGEISSMNIENSEFPVACVLKLQKTLTTNEINHILSISKNIQIS